MYFYTFHGLIDEGTVAEVNKPKEEPVVHGSGQGCHGVEAVVCVLPLVHPLSTDLMNICFSDIYTLFTMQVIVTHWFVHWLQV